MPVPEENQFEEMMNKLFKDTSQSEMPKLSLKDKILTTAFLYGVSWIVIPALFWIAWTFGIVVLFPVLPKLNILAIAALILFVRLFRNEWYGSIKK